MPNASRRAGTTLPELIVVTGLLSILGAMTFSASAGVRDSVAVRAARDMVAGQIAGARAHAVLLGSARLHVDATRGVLTLEAPVGTHRGTQSLGALDVAVSVDGAGAEVSLDFDALGLGRLANRTLRFRRRTAEARLTLSSFGRARRW